MIVPTLMQPLKFAIKLEIIPHIINCMGAKFIWAYFDTTSVAIIGLVLLMLKIMPTGTSPPTELSCSKVYWLMQSSPCLHVTINLP